MKNPIKSYFEWEENRWKTKGIKNWENTRAKGKWQFVLKSGLLWSLLTITGFTLFEYLLDGRINIDIFWFKLLLFVSLGFVVGLAFWRLGERKYQESLSAEKRGGLKEMKNLNLLILIALFLITGTISAQSLKPENPYPLQEGINQGTSDSLVGTHYWYFYATPGSNQLTVRFKTPTTLYGAQMNTSLTITLTDEKKTWRTTKIVTSKPNALEATFAAEKVKKKMKIIVSVAPPNQNLIRMGGDYEIEVTGDAEFDRVKEEADPIIRTFESKVNSYGATKFLADGTVETSDGFSGKWKVFDSKNRIYTVTIEKFRFSLQYLPGYGLVKPDSPDIIVFQELRR
jgi:hypothetical protein